MSSVGSTGSQSYTSGFTSSLSNKQTAEDNFMAFMKMTPAQRMRAQILSQLGYSEDQLKAMSAEDRAKAEEKIKELLEKKFRDQTAQKTEKETGVDIIV